MSDSPRNGIDSGSLVREGPMTDVFLTVLGRSKFPVNKPTVSGGPLEQATGKYPVGQYGGKTVLLRPSEHDAILEIYDVNGDREASMLIDGPLVSPKLEVDSRLLRVRADLNSVKEVSFNHAEGTLTPSNWSRWDNEEKAILARSIYSKGTEARQYVGGVKVCLGGKTIMITDSEYSYNKIWSDTTTEGTYENVVSCEDGSIYYCTQHPVKIAHIQTQKGYNTVNVTICAPILFDKKYEILLSLKHIPEAGIFVAEADNGLVIIDEKSGKELHKIPEFYQIHYENGGVIRGIDAEGHLLRVKLNLDHIQKLKENEEREKALRATVLVDLVAVQRDRVKNTLDNKRNALVLEKQLEVDSIFESLFLSAVDTAHIVAIEESITQSKGALIGQNIDVADVDKIFANVDRKLLEKKREIIGQEIEARLVEIESALARGLTLVSLASTQAGVAIVKSHSNLLTVAQSARIAVCDHQLDLASTELYRRETDSIRADLVSVSAGIDARLTAINGNKVLFDQWYGNEWPEEKKRLRGLLDSCPTGASEAYTLIRDAVAATDRQVEAAYKRFEQQYDVIREVATQRQDEMAGLIETDIDRLIELLDKQQFADGAQAQAWVSSQGLYTLIMESIRGLSAKDNLRSTELEHNLLSRVSSALDRKKRMEHTTVTDEGARTVQLGDESFPVWERTTSAKDKPNLNINLVFQPEPGQGTVKPSDRLGKVMLNATMANVTMGTVDLWRDMGADADTIRLGLASYRGKDIPPSVMTGTQYKDFQKKAADWNKGTASPLRRRYKDLRAKLRDTYKNRTSDADWQAPNAPWRETYKQILEEYADFCAQNHIVLLRQMERVSKQLEAGEAAQSIGAVPKWASHWVMDGETEKMLGQLAGASKMELALQEGVVNLKGHAGTGKDVLVKMLCHLSNRPYFAFDCTKWTTEYELAEDVQLVAVDGVTTTVRVPSSVLLALQTPGAVLYFNEFNAMPEQSQIYLHALFDEKRTMTIKTRSGVSIKADPTVLFISSMNPGYEGTYEPQLATKSRTIPIEVGYPALMNPDGKTYSSSEAWRIARGVDSLFRLTLQGDATDNAFVRAWNAEVNRMPAPNTPTLTPGQLFDLKVVTALVQFGDKLRAAFISTYERGSRSGGAKAMKINQPLTGREMRRFAYRINQITPDKKVILDPEQVAKDLIKSLFLVHIDSLGDRIEAQKAVDQMTVSKAA